MDRPTRFSRRDRQILVVGALCMLLSSGLCLALFLAVGRAGTDRMARIRTEMSLLRPPDTRSPAGADTPSTEDLARDRPAQIDLLVAEMNRTEMDLRLWRGISMFVSMAVGIGLFVIFRALQRRPIGPVLFGGRS